MDHFNEVSVVPSGVGAYAWHGYNGFPRAYMDRLCTVAGLATRGWGCTTSSATFTGKAPARRTS
ncbi:hypothetical protein [Streptomyces sp. NBC_00046]|uniref:hypothetical protein n=1 Tax=Streptomyces sp. NBC_00046 TaxID=2975626 RepID=UPI00324A216D